MNCNKSFSVNPNIGNKNVKEVFFMNRSFQEKKEEYENMSSYFKDHFQEADACVLSSHLVFNDIKEMIEELHARYYNVCGVFFENSITSNADANKEISMKLLWDERIVIKNSLNDSDDDAPWKKAIRAGATELCLHLLAK